MEYYSAIKKNTFESVLMRWMKLEPIIQSEASQKEMGIPDHLTCLLRNLYAGQEATVRTGHGTTAVPNSKRSTSRLYIVTLLI